MEGANLCFADEEIKECVPNHFIWFTDMNIKVLDIEAG